MKSQFQDKAENPESSIISAEIRDKLLRFIKIFSLSARDAEIIKLRFGFYDGHVHTLKEVAKKFNVTRERIRQIEAKVLRRLRHPFG